MNRLTQISLKNSAAVLILSMILILGGVYSATTLRVESMPDITFPYLVVSATYPASPSDVLDQVTKPIEKTIAGMDGVRNVVSYSTDNFAQVVVELDQDQNPEQFKTDAESALAAAGLPPSADLRVFTEGFSTIPVYYMSIVADESVTGEELNRIYKEQIEPDLLALDGIDHLEAVGAREAVVSIRLDAEALQEHGLTPGQVAQYIRASMAASPAGFITADGGTRMVRVTGSLDSLQELRSMKLMTPMGLIRLDELGSVEEILSSEQISRLNERPSISVHLYKTKEANQVRFSEAVNELIDRWNGRDIGVTLHTLFDDAQEIKHSISGMVREGLLGALLASLMILLFLRNTRMTLIVIVSIPLSILTSLVMMSWLDISLNIMTLGGLVISIGRVVDDSIVVIENIYAQLVKAQERKESVIKLAVKQVASAISSSTFTTVGVFVPIAFVSGIVGEVFVPFALTLVCALLASLAVALTVIPVLAKIMVLNSRRLKHHDGRPGAFVLAYRKTLVWSLKHWVLTLTMAVVLLAGSVAAALTLPVSFMPASESNRNMLLYVELPKGTPLEETDRTAKEIERVLQNAENENGGRQFELVQTMVGFSFSDEPAPERISFLALVSEGNDAKQVLKQTRERLETMLPEHVSVDGQVISIAPEGDAGNAYSYTLVGDDLDALKQASAMVSERMKQFAELSDIKESLEETKQEIQVSVDQEKAAQHGLSAYQVIDAVHQWIGVQPLGEIRLDDKWYTASVELSEQDKNSPERIGNLTVASPITGTVRVRDIAEVSLVDAPTSISREKQRQVVRVSAKIVAADVAGVSAKVTEALDQLSLPAGVEREVTGISVNIDKSFREMFVAMIASVLIVYLIMVVAFGNASAPFAILFSLPLAAIGGLFGLYVTGESVNVTSLIGFLMLIGIVVTNAIVLIDRVQQIRREGKPVRDALIEAGMQRLRPIIMTAAATVFTLLPLAAGASQGAVISKGLAVVVIGGLTTSTLLTLLIVPIVYERIERIKFRFASLFRGAERKARIADTKLTENPT